LPGPIVYKPTSSVLMLVFLALAVILIAVASIGNFTIAFREAGFNTAEAMSIAYTIVLISLIASYIDIPVARYVREVYVPSFKRIYLLGILPLDIPEVVRKLRETVVSVNIGGAVIPVIVSISLLIGLSSRNIETIPITLLLILLVAATTYPFSRVIPGVGVVVPALIPPLAAAIYTVLAASAIHDTLLAPALAYPAGTLGTLLGADVFNLRKAVDTGAPLISIGGMGTFDGIYLSGILSISLALLLA